MAHMSFLQISALVALMMGAQSSAAPAPAAPLSKQCVQLEVPLLVTENNSGFDLPRVESNIDAVDWVWDLTTWSHSGENGRVTASYPSTKRSPSVLSCASRRREVSWTFYKSQRMELGLIKDTGTSRSSLTSIPTSTRRSATDIQSSLTTVSALRTLPKPMPTKSYKPGWKSRFSEA